MLKFQALADEMNRLEQVLGRWATEGGTDTSRLVTMRSDIDALVSLAWGEAADSRRVASVPPASQETRELTWPATALVVGPSVLAEALVPEHTVGGESRLECERLDSPREALEMARALAPDLVVLDADLPGSQDLVERLVTDPLTEPVPLVVVGQFASADRAAQWLVLGASRVLSKPVSPQQLHETCVSIIAGAHPSPRQEPFGSLTLDQLALRLGDELKRGLCDAANEQGRQSVIPLGDGHEALAALWSAIVRVREIVTIRTKGVVRFNQLGPEGAVAVASWSNEGRGRGIPRSLDAEEQRLDGRVVLVADDDPSVTWFLSGVLRGAGATVLEAHDGESALRLAYRASPDLVVSDILMPKLDGFSLCRALKRDVAMRDVPVILLSWKEDLLQRMRELGANADGYLRKEASASLVLERVLEVLRPKFRVERRLSLGGEVRGRLDDLTVRTLLGLVSRHQPNARISVRDAAFLYEIEMRGGAPRSASRTTTDGRFERGSGVLTSLLGVGAGRFLVAPSDAPLRGWLEGTLEEQLRPAIAQTRAAQRLLSGTSLMSLQGVDINLEAIQPYFTASPEASRSILDKLSEGFSPRTLLLRAGFSARVLEDVLSDVVVHGGVARIVGTGGEDLLPGAISREMDLLEQGTPIQLVPPAPPYAALYAKFTPSPLTSLPPEIGSHLPASSAETQEAGMSPIQGEVTFPTTTPPETCEKAAEEAPSEAAENEKHEEASAPQPTAEEPVRMEPVQPSVAPAWDRKASPSPFEEAVRGALPPIVLDIPVTPAPGALDVGAGLKADAGAEDEAPGSDPAEPGSVMTKDLPVETSAGTSGGAPAEASKALAAPPEACSVPAPEPEPNPASEPATGTVPPPPASAEDRPAQGNGVEATGSTENARTDEQAIRQEASAGMPPVAPVSVEVSIPEASVSVSIEVEAEAAPEPAAPQAEPSRPPTPPPASSPTSGESAKAESKPGSKKAPWGWVGAVLMLGCVGAWWSWKGEVRKPEQAAVSRAPQAPSQPEETVQPREQPAEAAQSAISAAGGLSLASLGVEDLPLSPGETAEGQGVLEVLAGKKDDILVDRLEAGKGPQTRVPLPPGTHEVRARRKGEDQPLVVMIRAGRKTRVDMRGPWRRQ